MIGHLLAVAGLGALCGGWVALQRWVGRLDPEAPGVEGTGGCGGLRAQCGDCHSGEGGEAGAGCSRSARRTGTVRLQAPTSPARSKTTR